MTTGLPADVQHDPTLAALGLQVVGVLGEGGSAIVYRAHDARHGRDVAIKVLRTVAGISSAAERFSQEIRVAGRLRHPHILPLFDSGTLGDGRRFFVMPVAQGRPLSALIASGPLPVDRAVQYARETAEALEYLHGAGFVHRDVKPENILIESDHAVLTDFGLALPVRAARTEATTTGAIDVASADPAAHRFTTAGKVVGTLQYMSPEALLSDAPLDGRTDIYALGMVLYEMLTGDVPFPSSSPTEHLAQAMQNAIPSVATRRSDVPTAVDTIIATATARNVDDRYATAAEMAAALVTLGIGLSASDNRRTPARARQRLVTSLSALLLAGSGAAYALTRIAPPLDPHRIVVADLANDTGDSQLTGIGTLAGDVIAAGLTHDQRLTVVNATATMPSHLQVNLPQADSTLSRATQALVASTRAGVAVTGAIIGTRKRMELVVEVTDTRTNRVLGVAGPVVATADRPDAALRTLSDSVTAIVHRRAD